ncbi:AfsR/SARP family transcriptional regulator [Spirillospora sp. NPDC047279]|uniref:AfsR/SARP family transcriptional regulator n=1 Tax=Spirillospora sp. NPDC047279 TaxID=3155478 RepID=UPI0033FB2B63
MVESRLRISVLGPLRAWRDDAQLDLGPVRQRALLAALALRPGTTVSQAELLDGVWGLEPPGTGDKVVPVYVYRLRKCLQDGAPVITRERGGYRFDGALVDTVRLDELTAKAGTAATADDLETAVALHARALDLFHGEPLAGLPGPFAAAERFRLGERRVAVLQEKLEWQLRLGRYVETVGELSALAPLHPHSEPLCGLLMRALYGSGRQADALAAFTRTRRRLVDDLGVEPGEELRHVHQAVLAGDEARLGIVRRAAGTQAAGTQAAGTQVSGTQPSAATAGPHQPPPGRSGPSGRSGLSGRRDELPVEVGVLEGRERELAQVTAVTPGAVVAVDGVAGAGKTALAVRAAQVLRERYGDGCLFVDLHGHTAGQGALPPRRALRRLLRAVGAADGRECDDLDELAALWRAATASLRVLLVLDDAAGAEQVRPLLPGGNGSAVLVTSRRRLTGLDVDHRVPVGPLDMAAAEGLLSRVVGEQRAARERGAVRALARLCGRLPLALRIAGARMQNRPAWTFEHLVARLADDERRIGELTAEDRSVGTAFHLSYERLPPGERRAFRMLGRSRTVEPDRLTLAAMLACSPEEAEEHLESLVDANLVQQPAAGRYRLNELVAAFARRLAAREPEETAPAPEIAVSSGFQRP